MFWLHFRMLNLELHSSLKARAEAERAKEEIQVLLNERKQAEEAVVANRQKDAFLAMLGHELRNPLAPIRTASELLTRILGSQPDAQLPLAILRRQAQQLSQLVDDLLDVARVSQGLITIKKDVVEIGAVVDQALETVKPLVQEKSHRLSVHKPVSVLYVWGDHTRLVQSVGNLLHNAAKYTEAGGQIDVDVFGSDSEVVVVVRDSGGGIAPDVLPHIFDLFVQGPRALDRSQGGMGIGLTVVKQLIEKHGGTVRAASDGPGRGTTLTIRLPRAEPPIEDTSEDALASVPRRRILVVDDNADAARSLAMLLQLEGHEVKTAFSGPEALSTVTQAKPEVVFLDIGLPRMDGYEVARRLHLIHGAACPYLVALTGYGQPEDRARAQTAGFSVHLTKPVDPQQLRAVLSSCDLEDSGRKRTQAQSVHVTSRYV
jgi:signal transduction histidine kinase/CheY-like chemotaxis protein